MHNCKSVYNLIYLGSLAVVITSVRCIFLERHGPFSLKLLQTDQMIITVEFK